MFPSLLSKRSPFEPPHLISSVFYAPLTFVLQLFYQFLLVLRGSAYKLPLAPIRVICISDTHCKTIDVPDGDLLIHAGDLANAGTVSEIQAQIDWLRSLPHPQKIVICGNHDSYFDERSRRSNDRKSPEKPNFGPIRYLQHSSTEISVVPQGHRDPRLFKIYGAPQIPEIGDPTFAFEYPREKDGWSNTIPEDVDILVTHTPPKWHHDLSQPPRNGLGCEWLLKECWRVKPALHVFGHVHAAPGKEAVYWDSVQTIYERVCRRTSERTRIGLLGAVLDVSDLGNWRDALTLAWEGGKAVLWTRIWGGEPRRGGWMVNATATEWRSGQLKNKPQLIYL